MIVSPLIVAWVLFVSLLVATSTAYGWVWVP